MNKKLIILGRSGAGKTTVINEMIKILNAQDIPTWFFKSATTRKQRAGEGTEEYIFLTEEEFEKTELVSRIAPGGESWIKYGVLKNENNRNGVGFFSPISQQYAIDTANNMDNVQFVVIDLDREVRLQRLLERGEDKDSIQKRFEVEDKEGDYDFEHFPKDTIIIRDPLASPNELAKQILNQVKDEEY